jgi:transcription elongation factor GreA
MVEVKWLTQEAFDALTAELEEREGPLRSAIGKRIATAREEGDLKENGGYHAAREEQGLNEARVVQLRHILDKAKIGAPESAPDEAAHGKVVTISLPALGMQETFLLASREEAPHASIEVYSPSSPLGQAINGHKAGETVSYQLPNGNTMKAEIMSVGEYDG